MSTWTVYHGICDICNEEIDSEIEGDVDEFMKDHDEKHESENE
jgi:hypothetical protein